MKIIRKHPIALLFLIGIEMIGISGVLSVMENLQWDWQYAVVGLLMVVGAAVIAIATVIGIVVLIVKRNKEKNYPVEAVRHIALQYMSKTKFNMIYSIVLIFTMPVWPMVLVYLFENYTVGAIVISFGIMAYMHTIRNDVLLKRFYRIKNADKYLDVLSGEDSELLDSFYGDYVHVYREEYWDIHKPFIVNLLKREGTLGKSVKCYRVTREYLNKKYGFEYPEHYDKLILIPFSQFDINENNGSTLRAVLNSLSITRFTELVNVKYTYKAKESTDPSEYANTKEGIMLSPNFSDVTGIERKGSDVFICMTSAFESDDTAKNYFNVLMVIRNAEFLAGDADKEAKQIEMGYSNILSGFKIDKEKKTLSFMVMNDDEETEYENEEEEIANEYIGFDYRYDSIEWYWDGECNTEKTKAIIKRMTPKPADKK